MEFWDDTRYIRHIRRGPPDLPVKTILALVAGGITATVLLWPAQRPAQLPLSGGCATDGTLPLPAASAPGFVSGSGRLLPPQHGSTAGPAAPRPRPRALQPGTGAPATTSGPVASAAGSVPMGAQAVTYAVTPVPTPAPSPAASATIAEPMVVPLMTTPSATPTPSPSPSPSASRTHPGKRPKPSATSSDR